MLYGVGSALPEYRVKACNTARDSSNLIHNDEYARRFGFREGLVPGVTMYAYLTHSLVELLAVDWLQRGTAEVRFVRPVYEGEEVRISGSLARVSKEGTLLFEIQAANPQGITSCLGTASLPPRSPSPDPRLRDYPAGGRPPARAISLESLKIGERLTPIQTRFSWSVNWEYCQKSIRDHLPVYQHTAHPGWLLTQANQILTRNYDLPPWIHVSSTVQNHRVLDKESTVETRGSVLDAYERKGHHFVVLEVALFAGKHCLQTIRHTAIFRIAPRAA